MDNKTKLIIGAGCLLSLLAVCAVMTIYFGSVLIAINPGKAFAEARNTARITDVNSINGAIRLYFEDNRGVGIKEFGESCIGDKQLPVMDPKNGINTTEGMPVSSLSNCLIDYIVNLPTRPDGSVYRWGVDSSLYPTIIYVGVDYMDDIDNKQVPDYYVSYPLPTR